MLERKTGFLVSNSRMLDISDKTTWFRIPGSDKILDKQYMTFAARWMW